MDQAVYVALTSAVGSLGFPIVACLLMFYLYYKTIEAHKDESAKFADAITKMTESIKELSAKLGSR